jgi:hypothetical protein
MGNHHTFGRTRPTRRTEPLDHERREDQSGPPPMVGAGAVAMGGIDSATTATRTRHGR